MAEPECTPTVRQNSSLKTNPNFTKSEAGQLNPMDRLSDLPDFILHQIISFLGFKEACRTCILSKKWGHISNTNPIMDLSHGVFSAEPRFEDWYNSMVKVENFLEYVEARLQRYSKHHLRIDKLTLGFPVLQLTFPNTDEKVMVVDKIDEWVEIAVRNHVTELAISGPSRCILPEILFTAKSLRCLDCNCLEICYFGNAPMNFPSLESLFLDEAYILNDRTFNEIMVASPLLKTLRIYNCFGVSRIPERIVIPRCSKLESLDFGKCLSKGGTLTIDTSSLTSFQFSGDPCHSGSPWPVTAKDGVFRNLRMLKIDMVSITDEVLRKLLSQLILLVTLKLSNCSILKTIRISSALLEEIRIENCANLLNVSIDAPCLKQFKYKGDFEPEMCITVHSQVGCNVSLHIPPYYLNTVSFSKLKKLLKGLNSCDVFKIMMLDGRDEPDDEVEELEAIEFYEDELADGDLGSSPCDIGQLKLTLSSWILSRSAIRALLDGVFWTCRPLILSIRVNLGAPNATIKPLMRKLKELANRQNHPLKRIEVEAADCSDFLEESKLDVQLRLHW